MVADKVDLILAELNEGTGAAVAASVNQSGLRSALKIWFYDLDEKHGPVAVLRPYGLKGHQVELSFGNFSGQTIAQIKKASNDDKVLARALVASINNEIQLDFHGESKDSWEIRNGAFKITATIRNLENAQDDAAVVSTCRNVIVPIMAALAELIGYDEIVEVIEIEQPAFEGAILQSVITRRERNPRNRLLCIRLHGEQCLICGLVPNLKYGAAGSIIEVHHLEPLSLLKAPQTYNPETDLIPLCPSCHRALHTRRPVPLTPTELIDYMAVENELR